MKPLALVVVSALVLSAPLGAAAPRIRPLDPLVASALDTGARRSATFRSLLATPQAHDVIVHIVSRQDMPLQVAGSTRLVAGRGAARYVRIDVSASLTPKLRVSVLGHELQHACEIAMSGAGSAAEVEAFYQSAGLPAPTVSNAWETNEAAAVERRVWTELGTRAIPTRTIE